MEPDILIFSKRGAAEKKPNIKDLKVKVWRPGLFSLKPSNKSAKYLIYWFFHYFGIFRNRQYSSLQLFDGENEVASMLIVPKYFKWPFMNSNDVQFTYVMTCKEHRGKGLASKMIQLAFHELGEDLDTFWYVTDTANSASIKVAKKNGFELMGKGQKNRIFKIIELVK